MKPIHVAVVLFLGIASIAFWNTARTNRSWLTAAFGTSTGNRPEEDAYFAAAAAALDQFLLSRGYSPAVPVPTPAAGMHSGVERSVAYRSSPGASEPVTVIVTLHTGTSSGLSVNVFWEFVGFRWSADRHDALARDAVAPITAWWEEYCRKHPRR